MLAIALGALALGYAAICALVFAGQRRLLYPAPPGAREPRLHGAQLMRMGEVVALYVPPRESARTVVLFHGNGEDLADAPWLMAPLAAAGLGVLAVEYPGYGLMRAHPPSEAALASAAEAAVQWLLRSTPREQIALLGVSLGSGVATQLAARGLGARLMLVTPYTSIADVAGRHFPWLPARLLVRDRFDNLQLAPSITIPALVVHGTADEVIPFALGERLSKALPNAHFVEREGAHHNDVVDAAVLRELIEFAKR
jgi:pimeloyl-ACP methyl ester carboxylesterase